MNATQTLKVAPGGLVHKVAWAEIQNRALLFARSRGQTLFFSLGGKVNPGETVEQALMREAREEASVSLVESSIRHVHTFEGPCFRYVEGTILRMEFFEAKARGEIAPSHEIEELAWLTSKDKRHTTPAGGIILEWFHANGYID